MKWLDIPFLSVGSVVIPDYLAAAWPNTPKLRVTNTFHASLVEETKSNKV